MSRHLVITADDMGYSEERDNAIVKCYQAGAITRSSLMVNGHSVKHAVQVAQEASLPLGLHLNLTEGNPLSAKPDVHSLLGADEFFLNKQCMRQGAAAGDVNMDQVAIEVTAQIEKFKELTGHLPLYVDGHQHVHVFPGVRVVFAKLLAEYGIEWTRLPIENMEGATWVTEPRRSFFNQVVDDAMESKRVYTSRGIRFTDRFVGMVTMSQWMTKERLMELLEHSFNSPDIDSCELMVHPGFKCPADRGGCGKGPDEFAMSTDREYEMDIITNQAMRNFYQTNNFKLVATP